MSLRMIARDLYRLQQEVDRLESQLKAGPAAKREDLEEQLRKARAERDRIKRLLDGSKEEPAYRKPR
jgi:GAF domain-containing protein